MDDVAAGRAYIEAYVSFLHAHSMWAVPGVAVASAPGRPPVGTMSESGRGRQGAGGAPRSDRRRARRSSPTAVRPKSVSVAGSGTGARSWSTFVVAVQSTI